MDLGTTVGLVLSVALVVGSIIMGGGAGFFNIPALLVTVGGSLAATLMNYPLPKMLAMMKVAARAFANQEDETSNIYTTISDFAVRARRDGILALESDIENQDDAFLKKGFQMAVDGNSADIIRNVLDEDIASMKDRHKVGVSMFKALSNYAPAFGMIGTLIGLVQMLRNLDDPSTIGAGMAVALLTTLYGAMVSNMIALPIAGKLEQRSSEEVAKRYMQLEGILAIQEGNSPRVVQEKLMSFMPPEVRATLDAA